MLRDHANFHREGDDNAIFMTGAPGRHHDNENTRVDPLDDVFGSEPSSPQLDGQQNSSFGRAQDAVPSDIPRLRSLHVTNGYREGIAVSKEKHMQEGFDEGYTLGAELGLKAGWCLGALEGIWRALPATSAVGAVEPSRESEDVSREGMRKLLLEAEEELKVESLFGREYFGEDGIWLYEIPGQQKDIEEVTFEKIADAHPLVCKWSAQALVFSGKVGLALR